MQLSRELRGAVLPPQTAQQNQALSLRIHGEDSSHLYVLGHWFSLTQAKAIAAFTAVAVSHPNTGCAVPSQSSPEIRVLLLIDCSN